MTQPVTLTDSDAVLTLLDAAHAAVSARPEDDAARLRFYDRLADGEMFLLLETEAEGDSITPRVFELEDGPVVLAFDREERLAAFSGGIAPYAALPGRVIAGLLTGQGIGLGVNLGVAPSSMILPAEAMDWLAEALQAGAPQTVEARPAEFLPPAGLPDTLRAALNDKLAGAGALSPCAVLAGVVYTDGRRGHMLAFLDVRPGAEAALARAAAEALVFSGLDAAEMDVTFLAGMSGPALAMQRVGLRIDLPAPAPQERAAGPAAPGTDPARPPRLR